MREYSLKRDKFQSLFKKLLPTSLFSVLFTIILYFILRSSLKDTPVSGLIMLVCFIFFLYSLIKESIKIFRIRRDWISFKIQFSDDSIIKKQYNTPEIEITVKEISRIIKLTGGISIKTDDPQKFIFIPSDLENYEELIIKLNTLNTIEVSPIISVEIPSEYALAQHNKPGTILKKLLIGIGIKLGIFILFILLIIGLIYFLAN